MKFEFASDETKSLAEGKESDRNYQAGIGQAFRKRIQSIAAAKDIRDLYAIRSHRFEKLKGERSHQYSMRLNDQWRLIVEIREAADEPVIVIISIEDYHK